MAKSNKNLFGAPPVRQKSSLAAPAKLSAPRDTTAKALSNGGAPKVTPINFGSFRAKTTSTSQGSPWASLLQQATTGGIASALGGGLSAITGLGGLVSGILDLFGGSSSPPAPVEFTLPKSEQTTFALHQTSVPAASQASTVSATSPAGAGTGTGGETISVAYRPSAPVVDHSQVVQVVKQALLTSSSLNDVIAEI